jgi:ribulose-5-phosphate 4-epimerase/fuculose-1-phosphate aldolase
MNPDVATRALVAMCRAMGRRVPTWTQGTGGNVSVKADGGDPLLWIKASGARLDQVDTGYGLGSVAAVRLRAFAEGIEALGRAADPEQAYAALLANCAVTADGLGRPSMETGFHALLGSRWVLHLHSLAALLMVHEAFRDEQRFLRWWPTASPARHQIVRAQRPGPELMESVRALPSADVYLLENHGVILQGDDGAQALGQWERVERRFLAEWGYARLLEWWDLPLEVLREKVGSAAPLRIFFPDTAVFLDRLRRLLVPAGTCDGEPLWRLEPRAWLEAGHGDRDVAEIWLAQQLLLGACAGLAELPEKIAATVANLPLELLRRGRQGGPG